MYKLMSNDIIARCRISALQNVSLRGTLCKSEAALLTVMLLNTVLFMIYKLFQRYRYKKREILKVYENSTFNKQ